jgi:hypothetical protein
MSARWALADPAGAVALGVPAVGAAGRRAVPVLVLLMFAYPLRGGYPSGSRPACPR